MDVACLPAVCVGVSVFEEEDEPLVDAALAGDVFTFIKNTIVANAKFHDEVHRFLFFFRDLVSAIFSLMHERIYTITLVVVNVKKLLFVVKIMRKQDRQD